MHWLPILVIAVATGLGTAEFFSLMFDTQSIAGRVAFGALAFSITTLYGQAEWMKYAAAETLGKLGTLTSKRQADELRRTIRNSQMFIYGVRLTTCIGVAAVLFFNLDSASLTSPEVKRLDREISELRQERSELYAQGIVTATDNGIGKVIARKEFLRKEEVKRGGGEGSRNAFFAYTIGKTPLDYRDGILLLVLLAGWLLDKALSIGIAWLYVNNAAPVVSSKPAKRAPVDRPLTKSPSIALDKNKVEEIVNLWRSGLTNQSEIARRLDVSRQYVNQVINQQHATG